LKKRAPGVRTSYMHFKIRFVQSPGQIIKYFATTRGIKIGDGVQDF